MEGKIVAGSGLSERHISSFWSNRRKGFVLASLQARVDQVKSFVESCSDALMAVRGAMYPLNPPLNRLSQLLRVFKSPEDLKKCVRHQLIGGAKVALAFMRMHNPSLSFRDLHMLPSTVDDRVNFLPHYAEVENQLR